MNGTSAMVAPEQRAVPEPSAAPLPASPPGTSPQPTTGLPALQAGVGNAALAAAATNGSPPPYGDALSLQSTYGNAAVARSFSQPQAAAQSAPGVASTPVLIVEDTVEALGPGQMKKSDFLAELQTAVCKTAAEALAGTPWSERGCPYIEHWFGYYQAQNAQHVERAVRKYAPETGGATMARDYIPIICERVRGPIEIWAKTGQITGVPEGLSMTSPNAPTAGSTPTSDTAAGTTTAPVNAGPILPKALDGGARAADDPQAVQAQLGAGRPLEAGVQSRMGAAFGQDFSHVQLHTDATAGQLSSDLNARAFAVGSDIAFGAGQYRPGTLEGDLLIAHELAHVVQQRGSDVPALSRARNDGSAPALEANAISSSVAAVASMLHASTRRLLTGALVKHKQTQTWRKTLTEGEKATPLISGGLRLQRCDGGEKSQVLPPAPTSFTELPTTSPVPGDQPQPVEPAAGAQGTTTPQELTLPILGETGWESSLGADAALLILGKAEGSDETRVFVLPARGLVYQPVFPAAPATGGRTTPQRGPAFSLPAVGHAAVHLVRTGQGTGMLIDAAGTRSGQPNVLLPRSLQSVQTRFGISQIQGVLLTHTHADHVSGLTQLVQGGNITGNQVWVDPGWQNARVGPLGTVLQELGSGQHATRGFPAGWTPQALQTHTQTGPTGKDVTRSSLVVGEARLEMVTDTNQLRQFNQALQAGNWQRATRFADAASMLTHVSVGQDGPSMITVGDLRGRDIERLAKAMGEPAFRQFIGNARIVSGLHHLGAVSTKADARGLQRLLSAMGSGRQAVTVIAQTGGASEINEGVVRALQLSGARVIALGQPDPNRPGNITVRASGSVVATGAQDFPIDPVTRQAQQRIEQMDSAIRTLEATPTYRPGEVSRTEAISGIRGEVRRLEGLIKERMELATGDLHRQSRSAANEQRLQAVTRDLETVSGMEQRLTSEEVLRLARNAPQAGELERELRVARTRGEASRRFLELIAQVDPRTAREIMVSEIGRLDRSHQRRAWRRIRARLEAQVETQQALAMHSGPTRSGRAFAWFGLFLEAWKIAEPFITQAFRESQDQSREDVYRFFRDLVWWGEKGLAPIAVGVASDQEIRDPAAISASLEHRLHEDVPEKQRGRLTISPEAKRASSLQKLYIPPLGDWPEERRREFWTTFMLWTSAHIQNFDDYASEFLEGMTQAPVRQAPNDNGAFGNQRWQLRVGVIDDSGHVAERWQDSEDLTRIMNTTAQRVMRTTREQREERWTERHEPVETQEIMSDPGSQQPRAAGDQPTMHARFTSGVKPVYGLMNDSTYRLDRFRFLNEEPYFMVIGNRNQGALRDYVWVEGADYNTHAAIRSATVWNYVAKVRIPRRPEIRDVNSPDFMRRLEPEEYMNHEELEAWRLYTSNPRPNGVFFSEFAESESRVYRGEVTLYEKGPNYRAAVLLRREDLKPE